MAVPIIVIIVLPILCAIFGFAFGIAAARWRTYLGKHETYSQPSVTNKSTEVCALEEITIHAATPCRVCNAATITSSAATIAMPLTTPPTDQFNIGLPPPGLAHIRTPLRHPSDDVFNILDPHQAVTPQTKPNTATAAAASTTPFGPGTYTSRPRSPTAHLMGHLVRCASQAIEQIESQSVLHRLTSTDTANPASTQFFAPSPMPGAFLLSPPPVGGLLGVDHTQQFYTTTAAASNNTNTTTFTSGADEIHMDEVDLISKLGGGSFGSVYRGAWRGAPVAVKYIRTRTDKADSLGSAIREVVLSKKLTHPNIVQTFSWTVLAPPPPQQDGDDEDQNRSITGGGLNDFSRNGSNVSEISGLSSSFLQRNESLEKEDGAAGRQTRAAAAVRTEEEFEGYSIPAVWNNNSSKNTTKEGDTSNTSTKLQRKQQLKTMSEETSVTGSPSSSSTSTSMSRGVKRRRTGLDSATPSPTTLGLDPRMDSFNSEEGFGSPVKKKHGGVQSIFNLESLQLTETEALLVVVMEHCDLGSLQRALQRRAFLPSAKWPQHATFRALLRTAAEIAKGMEYIHGQHGVVHGDLKPANVLLKTHRADRRGYVAKVADFGLSWHVEDEEQNSLENYENSSTSNTSINNTTSSSNNSITKTTGSVGGTTAYLPPEAFEGSSSSRGRPGDVYAFGVMLWSMYYCKTPYEGLLEAQVCSGVLEGWLRPEFTEECPLAFRALAERCWAQNPAERPTFAQVWRELVNIEVDFRSARLRSKSGSGDMVFEAAENMKRPASAPIKV